MSDERLDFIVRLVDQITGPARGATSALDSMSMTLKRIEANGAMGKVAAGANKAARSLGKARGEADRLRSMAADLSLAAGPLQGLGRGMIGAFASPIIETRDFDQSMSRVRALTSDFNEAQRDLALKLGETTKFTGKEAADAMGNLGMAGFGAAEQMTAISHVLTLDVAGGMDDLATSATIASRTLRGFGLEASQMQRVGDVLTATFTNSNTTLSSLGETMSYVAPVAAAAGIPLEDVAKAAGMLGDAGIDGSRAGTTLRLAIANLAGASPPAAKELAHLGITTKDAAGNMLPLPKIMADIGKATAKMGTANRIKAITKIFGLRGAPGGVQLARQIAEAGTSFEKLEAAINGSNGAMAKTSAAMGDNLAHDITLVESALSRLKIAIGDNFTKPLRSMATLLSQTVIPWMSKFAGAHPTLVKALGWTAAAVGGLTLALGGLVSVMGSMAILKWTMVASGVSALGSSLGVLATMVRLLIGLKAAAMLGVIKGAAVAVSAALGVSIGALAAIVVAVGAAGYAIYYWWDDIVAIVGKLPEYFSQIGTAMGEGMIAAFRWVTDGIGDVVDGIIDKTKSVLGIHSPSRVMAGIGEHMSQGLEQGFAGSGGSVPNMVVAAGAGGGGGTHVVNHNSITIHVGGETSATPEEIGDVITAKIGAWFDTSNATVGG